VRPSANRAFDARGERRALIALFAAFALILQALAPAAAMAAPGPGGAGVEICTGHGLSGAPAEKAPAKDAAAGHACQHCVCPALATAAEAHVPVSAPVRFFAQAARGALDPAVTPPPARAPPRPPGQGPPTSNA
jgi:hypothetical protein